MNHVCVGVYNDGSYVVNVVRDCDLANNIEYNKLWRPGRAYIVDGKVVNKGYLTAEKLRAARDMIDKLNVNKSIPSSTYL